LNSIFIKKGGLSGVGQKSNPEILFSVTYLAPDIYQQDGTETNFYYFSALSPTENMVKIYSENDKRAKEWFHYAGVGSREWINPFGDLTTITDATLTGWILVKHFDKYHKENYALKDWGFRTDNDAIIFRYADILLMYIEAKVEQGGGRTSDMDAISYMNAIRERAGVEKAGTTISRDELRLERRKELAFEGLRYFDITRWKVAENVILEVQHVSLKRNFIYGRFR
jgi:starch-binding outer membrane protein, SusD/RagB family